MLSVSNVLTVIPPFCLLWVFVTCPYVEGVVRRPSLKQVGGGKATLKKRYGIFTTSCKHLISGPEKAPKQTEIKNMVRFKADQRFTLNFASCVCYLLTVRIIFRQGLPSCCRRVNALEPRLKQIQI